MISKQWWGNWERLAVCYDYPAEIRQVIYTTNAIESVNDGLRRVIKNRGSFPNDEAALKLLPSHAVLLNPARAGAVDEAALLAALREGTIAGAALDDHYRQPMPPEDPFFDLPNVIVTAHISGSNSSTWFVERIWDLFARNLGRYLDGDRLLNVIERDDLELSDS